MKKKCIYVN